MASESQSTRTSERLEWKSVNSSRQMRGKFETGIRPNEIRNPRSTKCTKTWCLNRSWPSNGAFQFEASGLWRTISFFCKLKQRGMCNFVFVHTPLSHLSLHSTYYKKYNKKCFLCRITTGTLNGHISFRVRFIFYREKVAFFFAAYGKHFRLLPRTLYQFIAQVLYNCIDAALYIHNHIGKLKIYINL